MVNTTPIIILHLLDSSEDLPKTCLDFETLSNVHVYRIEYVSYRQGPYRIRIDTAADRIVPALRITFHYHEMYNVYAHGCMITNTGSNTIHNWLH